MKRIVLLLLLPFFAQSQVGVNTPTPNAMLDVSSTNNGFLIPRIALTSAIDATTVVNPQGGALATSTLIYNTATAGASPNAVTPGFYYWNGTRWIGLGATPDWQINGNAGTNDPAAPATYGTSLIAAGENYVGTSDAQDLVFGVNGRERMRIEHATGDIGIGTANPNHLFTVEDRSYEGTAISGRNINASGDGTGVEGSSLNGPGFGYGGRFYGGFRGVVAVNQGGSHTLETIGINATSTGTAGIRVGGKFSASGGAFNYGIIVPPTGGNNGIGTETPTHKLEVQETAGGVAALRSVNSNATALDGRGIWATSVNNPGFGYGGYFEGGYMGVRAVANGSTYGNTVYGTYSTATGSAGTRIGGYFSGSGGASNYSIVAPQTGGFAGIGTITPAHRLHVIEQTPTTTAIHGENTAISNSDGMGVFGRSVNNPGYGYGGRFEGGYRGVYGVGFGGNYTGTTTGVIGYASGTAGTRVGGYFSAAGGATNLAVHADGTVRISDGTQAAGRVLTSDAAGNASWQQTAIHNVVGTLPGVGVNIPYTQGGTYLQTGSYIDLPPGRYAVNVTMLLSKYSLAYSPNNSFFWVRSTFSTSAGVNPLPTPDIIGSNLCSGNYPGSSVYALLSGMVIINNTTAGTRRYYYVAGNVVTNNTTETISAFGGSYWAENNIIAYRLN